MKAGFGLDFSRNSSTARQRRIGILHVAVPFSPPGCRLVNVYGISTGVGFRIRAFTVYEREQAHLEGLR